MHRTRVPSGGSRLKRPTATTETIGFGLISAGKSKHQGERDAAGNGGEVSPVPMQSIP